MNKELIITAVQDIDPALFEKFFNIFVLRCKRKSKYNGYYNFQLQTLQMLQAWKKMQGHLIKAVEGKYTVSVFEALCDAFLAIVFLQTKDIFQKKIAFYKSWRNSNFAEEDMVSSWLKELERIKYGSDGKPFMPYIWWREEMWVEKKGLKGWAAQERELEYIIERYVKWESK